MIKLLFNSSVLWICEEQNQNLYILYEQIKASAWSEQRAEVGAQSCVPDAFQLFLKPHSTVISPSVRFLYLKFFNRSFYPRPRSCATAWHVRGTELWLSMCFMNLQAVFAAGTAVQLWCPLISLGWVSPSREPQVVIRRSRPGGGDLMFGGLGVFTTANNIQCHQLKL